MDASPWGLGAVLLINGRITEFFTDPLTDDDVALYKHDLGDPAGQQTWESLAVLVALRLWQPRWQAGRVQLRIMGDSIAMLTLVLNMRPKSRCMWLIGQEIALMISQGPFVPTIGMHIPGIANTMADVLSMVSQPGNVVVLPAALQGAVQANPPRRDQAYYKTFDFRAEREA